MTASVISILTLIWAKVKAMTMNLSSTWRRKDMMTCTIATFTNTCQSWETKRSVQYSIFSSDLQKKQVVNCPSFVQEKL